MYIRSEQLHAYTYVLTQKNAVQLVTTQKSQTDYSWFTKTTHQWRPLLDLTTLNKFLKNREIQNRNTRDNKDLPPDRGVGNIHRFQACLLPHSNSNSGKEIPTFSHSVNSTCSNHCHLVCPQHPWSSGGGEGGQTDCISKGYKNPTVPR